MPVAVIFDITFSNGIGHADVLVVQNGNIITSFSFDETGSEVIGLDPGFYLVAVTGNSQGAEFLISAPTTPPTPDSLEAGIITKGYGLQI